jgi:hypothetical protein
MELSPAQLREYFIIEFPLDALGFSTEITPAMYLEYARKDLQDEGEARNIINAVSNAKRALHLQVDTIVEGYGYHKLKRSSKFPAKLEFLGEIGIATPSIISKLNTLRNKVEHDYAVPELEQIQDYCDIVELFLRATESTINTFPDMVELESNEHFDRIQNKSPRKSDLPEFLQIEMVKYEGIIIIQGTDYDNGIVFEKGITVTDKEYPEWIKQILEHVFRRI